MSPCIICFTLSVCNVAAPSLLAKACVQRRHLILAFQKVYARSPPGPTWKSSKLDWASSGSDLSNFEWAHERKPTQKSSWFFPELSQGQTYMHMQCRHGPFTNKNVYAMSPLEPCFPKSVCKVATFHCFELTMMCNVAMWPPPFQSQRNQIPLRCQRNLKIMSFSSYFVCSVAMRYLLWLEPCMQCRHVGGPASDMQCRHGRHATRFANSTLYAMSPCDAHAMSPLNLSQCIPDMQCRRLPLQKYEYMQCRRLTRRNALPICNVASSHIYSMVFKGCPQSLNHQSV